MQGENLLRFVAVNSHQTAFLSRFSTINNDLFVSRLFCDLHGNELLYHKPKGGVKGDTAGYDAAPAGKVDMFKVSNHSSARQRQP